jgi:hypothetical protein
MESAPSVRQIATIIFAIVAAPLRIALQSA